MSMEARHHEDGQEREGENKDKCDKLQKAAESARVGKAEIRETTHATKLIVEMNTREWLRKRKEEDLNKRQQNGEGLGNLKASIEKTRQKKRRRNHIGQYNTSWREIKIRRHNNYSMRLRKDRAKAQE